jgi:short-subunit dehydrogenase
VQYALVSGGSKGIGYAIAKALARRKFNLVLVARNQEDLAKAKSNLENEYAVQVTILALDISLSSSAAFIAEWCNQHNISLKMLCNVAGIGGSSDYLSLSLADSLYMLRLNTEPAIALTYELLPLLKKNSPSHILNVSSMAGLAPLAAKNVYSATKSAILFFSCSLRYQLKKWKVGVSCLCPGPVFTKPEIEEDTIEKLGWFGKKMAVTADAAGETAVRQALRNKMIIVPGRLARAVAALLRILPLQTVNFLAFRKSVEKTNQK